MYHFRWSGTACKQGVKLEDLFKGKKGKKDSLIVGARVNNQIKELTYPVEEECTVEAVDLTSEDGVRIYQRSLTFLLIKAVHDLFPGKTIQIRHSVSRGIFFEILDYKVTTADAEEIEKRMHELVQLNKEFKKATLSIDEAREIFLKTGREDRYRLVKTGRKIMSHFINWMMYRIILWTYASKHRIPQNIQSRSSS